MALSFMQITTFIIIYLLFIRTSSSVLLSHDEECLALLEFKQSFLHQRPYALFHVGGSQKLDSWKKTYSSNKSDHVSDCCLWDGVACSYNHHVIGLNLSQSSLHGSLHPNTSLFNLVHLQMLDLSMNNFVHSQIPYGIARLKQLRHLDLRNSSLSGQIPAQISHLTQLTSLSLSWNSLELGTSTLEFLLQNMTRLETLRLSGVVIGSSVPPFLANVSSLEVLILFNCGLLGEFPSGIFNLPKLRILVVETNPVLTGFIPEFQNNSLLEVLGLRETSFAGEIPKSIGKLNHLEYVSLLDSYISGCIPTSLYNMTRLTHLALGPSEEMGLNPSFPPNPPSIGLEVCDKRIMCDWFSKLSRLESLFLVGVKINDEILPSLANLTKLRDIQMRQNLIFGHIPSSFMNLTQLTHIDLAINQLQGQIPNLFSSFKCLEILVLSYNKFSGRVDLNTFIGLTSKLNTLFLGENIGLSFITTDNHNNLTLLPDLHFLDLSSCNLREFPIFLRFQKKLEVLFLFNNQIKGLIPEWMWNVSKETLKGLDLSENFITGFHQHPQILPWVRLEHFHIDHNQLQGWLPIPPPTTISYAISNNDLTGEIPPLICEAKSLEYLDLSSNNLTGTLPPCLEILSNLLVLDLKRNNFHGPMMNAFMHGCPMKRIDLSQNQFTGHLSKSLANCSDLELLAVGGNAFKDIFPFWLGYLAKFQVLILRSNHFFGSIQDLTTNRSPFVKLRIIDLSHNNFCGQLPKTIFQTWHAMQSIQVGSSFMLTNIHTSISTTGIYSQIPYTMTITYKHLQTEYPKILNIFTAIDLSCNKFEGPIPESLGDLHSLQSVNVSNNYFTGGVLTSLGNLKNIESLDLSHNQLTGEIPQQLLQLGFLAVFNVSINHLHGVIPRGKQFDTFDNSSYIGNPRLCGIPLSKDCRSSITAKLPWTKNEYESFLPRGKIDWIIICLGVGCGLVIGIVLGNLLYENCDWLIESTKRRKYRWVRPLRNTRKN